MGSQLGEEGALGETPGRPREARAGGRTCAPRPPRLSPAAAVPTAWSRSSPQVSRPWPQSGPGPEPLRSGCRARGAAPGRTRRVDAPGSHHFRFRSWRRLREDGGGRGGLGPAGHLRAAGVCVQPQRPESVGTRSR